MKLMILLHVKSNHQAEKAIETLSKLGAVMPPQSHVHTLPLGRVCAVGAGENGIIHLFFKHMDTVLPPADIDCHVYEVELLDSDVKLVLVDAWMMAAHRRALCENIALHLAKLNEASLVRLDDAELTRLYASLYAATETLKD